MTHYLSNDDASDVSAGHEAEEFVEPSPSTRAPDAALDEPAPDDAHTEGDAAPRRDADEG